MRTRLSLRLVAGFAVGALLASLATAASAAQLDVTLSPPEGQTAVSASQQVRVGGTAEQGASITSVTLRALDASDTVLAAYDRSRSTTATDGRVDGTITIGCSVIPGCPTGDDELRARVAGYSVEVRTDDDAVDVSNVVDFDERRPRIISYQLTSTTTIEVRFDEDVTDPEGDNPMDWIVDGERFVRDVAGEGDARTLVLRSELDRDATPRVHYFPFPSPDPLVSNQPYVDGAGNVTATEGRNQLAVDAVAPPVPSIATIDGTSVDDGPVLGTDPSPVVGVDAPEAERVELYLDDGDGEFEPGTDDPLVGSAEAADGSAEVTVDRALADAVHTFWARSLDGAACDPNDAGSTQCPNASGRSAAALYDLDTLAPTLVPPALATRDVVQVAVSEDVVGDSVPGDWTLTGADAPTVVAVEVRGSSVRLDLDAEVTAGRDLVYTPGGLADEHGNGVPAATLPLEVGALPVVQVGTAPVDEGTADDGPVSDPAPNDAVFELRLSAPSVGEASVAYEVVGGTAELGDDVVADRGTVTFADGQERAEVTVGVVGDALHEFDETFVLRVSDPVGVRLPADRSTLDTTGTVVDDDPMPALEVDELTLEEGSTGAFRLRLAQVAGRDVEVRHDLASGSATVGRDVTGGSGTTTIRAGQREAEVLVTAVADGVDEDTETFLFRLGSVAGATTEVTQVAGTVLDTDPTPAIVVDDVRADEGTDARVVVRLASPSAREVTVRVSTRQTTPVEAEAGDDYTTVSRSVTIGPGANQAFVDVALLDDRFLEPDERLLVVASDPTNAVLDGREVGTVTIVDRTTGATDPGDGGTDDGGDDAAPGGDGGDATDPDDGGADGGSGDGADDGATDDGDPDDAPADAPSDQRGDDGPTDDGASAGGDDGVPSDDDGTLGAPAAPGPGGDGDPTAGAPSGRDSLPELPATGGGLAGMAGALLLSFSGRRRG